MFILDVKDVHYKRFLVNMLDSHFTALKILHFYLCLQNGKEHSAIHISYKIAASIYLNEIIWLKFQWKAIHTSLYNSVCDFFFLLFKVEEGRHVVEVKGCLPNWQKYAHENIMSLIFSHWGSISSSLQTWDSSAR